MDYSYITYANALQMEISTKCNALCPSCIRTDDTSLRHTRSIIPQDKELEREDIKKIFSSQWAQKLDHVEFCGTMDEPLMHSSFLEILDDIYLLTPHISVQLHTNAGLRNPKYFAKLAEKVSRFGNQSIVKFSIDGLRDTNSIYRYKVNWEKVIENLKAYTENKGRAEWQMLVFPWNEHQVDEARTLAKAMGCFSFKARPDRSFSSVWGAEKMENIRAQNNKPFLGLHNGNQEAFEFIQNNMMKPVNCVYKNERKMVFISWDGNVWPCCFWTHARYENKLKKEKFENTVYLKYGENFNNLKHHSFDEILNHSLFQKDLLKSWETGSDLKWRCVEKCSVEKVRSSDGKKDDKRPLEYTQL